VRVVPREVPTSRLPRGRIDDPVIHDVVVVRQIATEEAQIEIAVDVSVVVGFSSNPPSGSNDMIGFICDVSALPDATDQLARLVEVRRRDAVRALCPLLFTIRTFAPRSRSKVVTSSLPLVAAKTMGLLPQL
jgi:hypothetical protein